MENTPAQADAIQEKQKRLFLSELRAIFQLVEKLAFRQPDERAIVQAIVEQYPHYQLRFTRWLVRHTLHPQTDDDIMSDEIKAHEKHLLADGTECLILHFHEIPPTVRPFLLVQYGHTFWHVVEYDAEGKQAMLRPLATYKE
ncbi:MAG: hypothetical protein V1918_10975 [Planctomycetota bacterium]